MSQALQVPDLLLDYVSGSSQLLRKVVSGLLSSLQNGVNPDRLLLDLEAVCRAYPSMALLRNFAGFFHKIPLNPNRIHAWLDMYHKHEAAASLSFANHLSHFKNVLVYSNSGLIHSAVTAVSTPLNIYCTEGRPSMEGRLLAEQLAQTHHHVYLMTDIAAFSVLSRVEIVAFGCDAITPRGVINKIGTSALAQFAATQRKMVCFVGTSEKIIEQWSDDFLLREGPRAQVAPEGAALKIENYYFDLTPPEVIRGVFLETGLTEVF